MESDVEHLIAPYLKRGEKLLWEGVAERGFRWRMGELIAIVLGLAFTCGPMLALLNGAKSGLLFIFLVFGLLLLIFGTFTGWWVRQHSRYALTNLNGYLILDHPVSGVQVKRYLISRKMTISKKGTDPASVYFANSERVMVQGLPMRIGFAMIKDADRVYEMMRKLQGESR